MKLAEFAQTLTNDNGYVGSMVKDKTVQKSPAYTTCTEEIFKLLKLYLAHFQNRLEGISTSPQSTVFPSSNVMAL